MSETLYRKPGETQKRFVARMLHERGSISAAECLDSLAYPDGTPTRLTRLAARIHELTSKEGFEVAETESASHFAGGPVATYTLVRSPYPVVVDDRTAYRAAA